MIELRNIALDAIIESTFNPRKNFDPAKLAELAESIKASGVLQPILVRPLTGDRVSETDRTVQFEIIAGARRFRASEVAGLKTIPAIVRAMSNDAALEAAILENLQRDMAQALGYTFAEGEDKVDALAMHIKACSVADLQRATIIVMAETDRMAYYSDTTPVLLDTLVEVLGVPAKAITKAATKEVLADHADERNALQAQIDAQKKPEPKAPAAPPAAPAAKTKPAARKGKMSAAEATASIAAAMQDQDDDQVGGDDQDDDDDGVPNIANDTPRMGVKVRISAQHLHPKQQKYAGKEGTITGKVGDAWDVTFRGRSGGISSFMTDQISVVLV